MHPRRACGERFDLELVLPPPGANRQPVALTQHHHVAPQLFEPQSPLTRVEAVRVQLPARVGQLVGIVGVVVGQVHGEPPWEIATPRAADVFARPIGRGALLERLRSPYSAPL